VSRASGERSRLRRAPAPTRRRRRSLRERVQIDTALGALDVVQGLPGVPSYSELKSRAQEVEILGVRLALCSLDDLRAMKRAAGRTRDLADLEDLVEAHGEE
jgi:predicted nucleotidyltransferase